MSTVGAGTGVRIHWLRILLTALAVEAVLIVATIPLAATIGIEPVIPYVPLACLVGGFAVTYALTRPIRSAHFTHGFLIGLAATVIYLGLSIAGNGSLSPVIELYGVFLFVLANVLRVVGTTLGALARRW